MSPLESVWLTAFRLWRAGLADALRFLPLTTRAGLRTVILAMKRIVVVVSILAVVAMVWAGYLYNQRKHGKLDEQEFRAALEKYLAARPGLNANAMNIEVVSLKQRGDQAEAVVAFHAKQGGPSMQFTFHLERQGNAWVVEGTGVRSEGHP